MVPLLAALALISGPPKTHGDVEAYHSPDNRVACVMILRYDSSGNAVRCGHKGSRRGLLLATHGAARSVKWRWPDRHKLFSFTPAPLNQTLYLVGGTAKLDGNAHMLRCTFTGRSHVRCLNGAGHGVDVTRKRLRKL